MFTRRAMTVAGRTAPRSPARTRFLAWALLAALGCGDTIAPGTPGSIKVTVTTMGEDIDPDGYLVLIPSPPPRVPSNGSIVVTGLTPGDFEVVLDDIAPNCTFAGDGRVTVTVPPGRQVAANFALACIAPLPNDLVFQATLPESLQSDIFRVNANGLGLRNLTMSPGPEFEPIWKPDGSKIAFTGAPGDRFELFTMDPDGTNAADLGVALTSGAWSPDGARLAGSNTFNLFLLNSDGTGLTQLTNRACIPGAECGTVTSPSWSPDGTRIVYQLSAGFPGPPPACWVINTDGTGATTQVKDECAAPAWSPDGTRIAFTGLGTRPDNLAGHILLMNPDGSATVDLSLVEGSDTTDGSPSWSPDGSQLAFLSNRDVPEDVGGSSPRIFIMNANGTGVRHVALGSPVLDIGRPTWGPAAP
jgi:TolB protein